MATFTFDDGILTSRLARACALRIRVSMSAMGSCKLINIFSCDLSLVTVSYQLAFTRPGISPRMAASRSLFRPNPNFR